VPQLGRDLVGEQDVEPVPASARTCVTSRAWTLTAGRSALLIRSHASAGSNNVGGRPGVRARAARKPSGSAATGSAYTWRYAVIEAESRSSPSPPATAPRRSARRQPPVHR